MKKSVAIAMCATAAMASSLLADTVTSVNVVGYYNVTIGGDPSVGKYSLVALPMTKLPVTRGTISANTATTLTDSSATWSTDEFSVGGAAANELGVSTYFVEVTTGAFEGRHFYIAGNSSDTLTLVDDPGDLDTDDLLGATYKIIAANRVRDIYGEPPNVSLLGGSSTANADSFRFLNADNWDSAIFYRDSGLGGIKDHWLKDGEIADDVVIDRDEGMIVYRVPGNGDATLSVSGEVSGTIQSVPVSLGFSLVNGMSAAGEAIGNTTLTNVLQGGSSTANADTIRGWDGDNWASAVFFRNSGLGGILNHWVQDGMNVDDTFILEPGQAYLITKQSGGTELWDRQSPLD